MKSRVVVIAVAFTVVATFYSLSELHRISAEHASADKGKFVTHTEPSGAGSTAAATTKEASEPRKLAGDAGKASSVAASGAVSSSSAVAKSSASTGSLGSAVKGNGVVFTYPNTELWGDVVVWGSSNKAKSAEECGSQCRNHKPPTADDFGCNVFVFCGDQAACKGQYGQCWLKHLAHPEASKPARSGANVPWTSGTLDVDINGDPGKGKKTSGPPRKFHVVTSAQGSAVHWQCRVHYYWYRKQKAKCIKEQGDACEMGGWTRLLHSGKADDLMDELPTMVVDPLPSDMVEHSWYVVLNRPYAFVQWVKQAKIPEKYVLMAEPDHIFLRPLPNFMNGNTPAAFPFFYIEPAKAENQRVTMKFTGPVTKRQLEQIAPIGNSPTFMTMEDMIRVMPVWMNVSIAVFKDTEANQAWGWVQEMYGFTIGAFNCGIKHVDLYLHLMAQPPWDTNLEMAPGKPFYILHYTYGMDYKLTGEFTPGKFGEWRFDKRTYSARPVPRHITEPPKNMKNDLVRALVNSINEATDAIPCWDKYAETGVKPKACTEKPKHFYAELEAAGEKTV